MLVEVAVVVAFILAVGAFTIANLRARRRARDPGVDGAAAQTWLFSHDSSQAHWTDPSTHGPATIDFGAGGHDGGSSDGGQGGT